MVHVYNVGFELCEQIHDYVQWKWIKARTDCYLHSRVLLILKSNKDSDKDNEEAVVEEGRKFISNPLNKVDFVNADECTMTTATITTKKFCQLINSGNGGECGGSDKQAHGKPTYNPSFTDHVQNVPRFGLFSNSFRWYTLTISPIFTFVLWSSLDTKLSLCGEYIFLERHVSSNLTGQFSMLVKKPQIHILTKLII